MWRYRLVCYVWVEHKDQGLADSNNIVREGMCGTHRSGSSEEQ